MCGLAGFVSSSIRSGEHVIKRMTDAIAHRGPDDYGVWLDSVSGIALGHRRLSIVDLSPHGSQPMSSACGRYVIVFNGEIYNHLQIRSELERENLAPQWLGNSDTEIMLAAIVAWGMDKALQKFVGMFAFALWDRYEKILTLARDRLGEKPLYYGWFGDSFLFASELKAFKEFPGWSPDINRDALARYLQYSTVATPYSIYQGIFKLIPGTVLRLTDLDRQRRKLPEPSKYWRMQDATDNKLYRETTHSDSDYVDRLESLLRDAIQKQMCSDVPLGAFLSGGVDSSLIVALMQASSPKPIKTFTIGFKEHNYNEAQYAKAVAEFLGTDHTELYVTPGDALNVITDLPNIYDEPFADSSQIPTVLLSKLARQKVTVSLSGDGGDELFGGYNRYRHGKTIWKMVQMFPMPFRKLLHAMLTSVPPSKWDGIFRCFAHLVPSRLHIRAPGDKLHKFANVLRTESSDSIYQALVSHWQNTDSVVVGSSLNLADSSDFVSAKDLEDFVKRMMYLDTVHYLPDDILTKVDRAAMSTSLETRMPMLDHRVVEYASQMPLSLRMRFGQGKWPLRQILYRYVPSKFIERPKMGFGVPLDSWLRGPLRDWSEALLNENRLSREGYFDPRPIRLKWEEHISGRQNWQYHLWDVLMFQMWLERHHG